MPTTTLDDILAWIEFCVLTLVILVAPWLFGGWEAWHFWPMVGVIFLSTAVFASRILGAAMSKDPDFALNRDEAFPGAATVLLISFAPFLGYALVRALQARVYADAERSFLLFLTPALVGLQIVYGMSARQRRWLFYALLANLFLLGLYGLINHAWTGSQKVLWMPGYPQYTIEHRATGSYFCPDHFAGIMELALGLGLGLGLTRGLRRTFRIGGGILSVIALVGIVLSKSRGGGLTVIVMAGSLLVWGFWQWRPRLRWALRGLAVLGLVIAMVCFAWLARAYTERFMAYFGGEQLRGRTWKEARSIVYERVNAACRPQMIRGALRAWKTEPVLGIGPGMHQNLWFHFAATPDGDRERGIWPTHTNNHFHSYEVHSDWVQLLEEYGAVGFGLFLVPTLGCLLALVLSLRRLARSGDTSRDVLLHYAMILGGLSAWVCMTFHSLGDFNLQMPATGWTLAAILAIALSPTPYRVWDDE